MSSLRTLPVKVDTVSDYGYMRSPTGAREGERKPTGRACGRHQLPWPADAAAHAVGDGRAAPTAVEATPGLGSGLCDDRSDAVD